METQTERENAEANKNLLTSEQVQKDSLESNALRNKQKKPLLRVAVFLCCGIFNTILGALSIHYNFVELIMEERIRMRPGLPPYELWRNPPVSVLISVTLYNVTNAIEFLDGIDDRLKLQEVGPIVFAETMHQKDIVHHYENSTMSFTTERSVKYLPEQNDPGILNKSMIVVNPTLLGLAAYLHDSNFLQKFAFRMISSNDDVFLRRTVYEILWNNTSPMLERLSTSILSVLLPRNNSGIMYNAYFPKVSRYNVRVGVKYGFKEFFKMNSFNGQPTIPGFEGETRVTCPVWLTNARDGANLPPYMTKDTVLTVWREDVCTTVDFFFEKEINWRNLRAYKYAPPASSFNRLANRSLDCHSGHGEIPLPNGIIDSSMCSFDVPTAISFPHYYGSDGFYTQYVEGMEPDKDKHGSYAIIEPITGFPLEEVARVQSNLIIPNLQGYTADIERFSNMILPGFWVEYSMKQLPPNMIFMTKMIVIYTPIIQIVLTILAFTLAIGFLYFGIIYFLQIDPKSPRKILITKMNPFRVKRITLVSNTNRK